MRRFVMFTTLALGVVIAGCGENSPTAPDAASLSPRGVKQANAPAGSLVYIVYGNGQAGQPSTVVGPRDPYVVVRKSDGTNVANGTTVTFTCSGDCKVSTPTALTVGGMAATRWQLPSTNGTAYLDAQVSGGGSVRISANVGGVILASSITKGIGDAQTAKAGTAVPFTPTVKVRDAGGNLLPGAVVTFVPSGNGKVSSNSVTTDANGEAATVWQLGTDAGSPTLDASVNGGTITTQFTATATPIPGSLTKTSDTPDNCGSTCAPNGFAGPQDPIVQLKDNNGAALAGTGITFTPAAGCGAVSSPSTTTDGSGNATTRWQLPKVAGQCTMTASVVGYPSITATFTATVTMTETQIAIVQGQGQSGTAGQVIRPSAPYVVVKDANGYVMKGVTVTWTPSGNGKVSSVTSVTDAAGQAATEWQLPTSSPFTLQACILGGSVCQTFNAVATAIPASMDIVQGNAQSGTAGTVVGPRDPVVIVKDANGNAIAGISVVFSPSGNGVVSSPTATTDSNGNGATRWQLGTTPGAQTLTATVTIPNGGGTLTRTFTATAN